MREGEGPSAALLGQLGGLVSQLGGLGGRRRLHVHALRHLDADDVDQSLEHLPHIDVLLGTGLVVLEACSRGDRQQGRQKVFQLGSCVVIMMVLIIWSRSLF